MPQVSLLSSYLETGHVIVKVDVRDHNINKAYSGRHSIAGSRESPCHLLSLHGDCELATKMKTRSNSAFFMLQIGGYSIVE